MIVQLKNDKNTNKMTNKICEVARFFIDNPWSFWAVGEFQMRKIFFKQSDNDAINETLEIVQENYLIEEKQKLDEFKQTWFTLSDGEKGTLLEYLISILGPYDKILSNQATDFVRDSRVYTITDGSTTYEIPSKKDLDVIFFCTNQTYLTNSNRNIHVSVNKQHRIEFHEAKKNVLNSIPMYLNMKLSTDIHCKLELFKYLKTKCPDSICYIPTFLNDVSASQKYLEENGYAFVKILSVQDILDRYFESDM